MQLQKIKVYYKKEASGLLSKLVLKTSSSIIPVFGNILIYWYKMNEAINNLFLAGEKFMSKSLLRQPRFKCCGCGSFTKNKGRIQTFKNAGPWRYIYQYELDKTCFQKDMAYGKFKD